LGQRDAVALEPLLGGGGQAEARKKDEGEVAHGRKG
jgi:hypothetical protein